MAQRATLTPAAAARRAITVMRRIDQDTACAGCGEAGPWLCAWVWPWTWGCPWSWLWALEWEGDGIW